MSEYGSLRLASPLCVKMKLSTLLAIALATPTFAIFQLGCGEACNGVIDGFELDCTPSTHQHHGTCELFWRVISLVFIIAHLFLISF